ncbi:MAG: DUF4388 domain-containing protein [Planctomycetota bacterium]
MLSLSPENQLRIYSVVRSIEARTAAFDSIVGSVKRTCVHGGLGVMTEIVSQTAELKWQLRKLHEESAKLAAEIGLNADPVPTAADATSSDSGSGDELPGLRGTTRAIGMPDLISTLSSLGKTGTLALNGDDVMFVFELQEGRIVHAVTNQGIPDMRLGTILVAQNKLTEEQLAASLQHCNDHQTMLGSHLVESATVTATDLRTALDEQVRRIFEHAFALDDARFTFLEGSISQLEQRTTVNTTELLLEAARQQDEYDYSESSTRVSTSQLDDILGD